MAQNDAIARILQRVEAALTELAQRVETFRAATPETPGYKPTFYHVIASDVLATRSYVAGLLTAAQEIAGPSLNQQITVFNARGEAIGERLREKYPRQRAPRRRGPLPAANDSTKAA